MTLKERLVAVETEEELNQVLESASLDELKKLKREMSRVELTEEHLDQISGGAGYMDVLEILASAFGVRRHDIFGKIVDKISKTGK